MADFNELAKGAEGAKLTKAWLVKKPPIVYIYGPTGEGKTHSIGGLIKHELDDGSRPYGPVLYIDADEGNETIGELAEEPELCTLWEFDGRYEDKLAWLFDRLDEAEDFECGAIVIEGLNALFKSMLAPEIKRLTKAKGVDLWTAHNEPAQRMDTVFEAIKKVKINRRASRRGVPIFVTLNVREVSKDSEDPKQQGKMFVPNFSPNRIRAAMGTSDAFLELRRGPSGTRFLAQRDAHNHYRKLRRSRVAQMIDAEWNLSLPGMLTLWAIEAARAQNRVNKHLKAANDRATEQAKPEPGSDQ